MFAVMGARAATDCERDRKMKTTNVTGKAFAGHPHVAPSQCYGVTGRFDEWEVASAMPRRGVRVSQNIATRLLLVAVAAMMGMVGDAATIESKAVSKDETIMRAALWSNNEMPSSAHDYILKLESLYDGDHIITDDNVRLVTFPGNSLTVKDVTLLISQSHYGDWYWLNFVNDGFFMEGSALLRSWNSSAANLTVNMTGTCFTVKSPVDGKAPSIRSTAKGNQYTTTYAFHLPFKGPSDAELNVDIYTSTYNGRSCLEFDGDASQFYGMIKLLRNNHSVRLCGGSFGGTVRLVGASTLEFCPGQGSAVCNLAKVSMANEDGSRMVLKDNATARIADFGFTRGTIEFPQVNLVNSSTHSYTGGCIEVTGSVTGFPLNNPIEIVVFGDNVQYEDVTLIKAPSGTLSVNDFSLTVNEGNLTRASDVELQVVADEVENCDKLVAHRVRPLVYLKATDSGTTSSFDSSRASNWSDGLKPHENADYVVPAGLMLKTLSGTTTFPGNTLYIYGELALCGSSFVNNGRIVLIGGCRILPYADPATISGGIVETRRGANSGDYVNLIAGSAATRSTRIESEIEGNCDIQFFWQTAVRHSANPMRLGNLNTNFTGRVRLPHGDWNGNSDYRVWVNITDPRNFGGPLPSVDEWGLITSRAFVLAPTQSMTFTDSTRAATFQSACFHVKEGVEFGLCHRYTWSGTVQKTGGGTLGLGGRLLFLGDGWTSRQTTPPTSGLYNALEIAEGWLKPLSTNGCDGLAVTFGDGAGFRLNCGRAADDPVKRYGCYDVQWATPFSTKTANAPISVAFDGVIPEDGEELAVATVANHATAVDLKDRLVWVRTDAAQKNYKVSFSVRDNADGTATVSSTLCRKGFVVTVR